MRLLSQISAKASKLQAFERGAARYSSAGFTEMLLSSSDSFTPYHSYREKTRNSRILQSREFTGLVYF